MRGCNLLGASTKKISAKLGFIREFEAFVVGKPFAKIKTDDVAAFRKGLMASAESDRDNKRSISTVRHCASHLKSFFKCLVDQKGIKASTDLCRITLTCPENLKQRALIAKKN